MHLLFRSYLNVSQSQNPQRSPAMPAVLFNHRIQIWPKFKRNISQVIPLQALDSLLSLIYIKEKGAIFL